MWRPISSSTLVDRRCSRVLFQLLGKGESSIKYSDSCVKLELTASGNCLVNGSGSLNVEMSSRTFPLLSYYI